MQTIRFELPIAHRSIALVVDRLDDYFQRPVIPMMRPAFAGVATSASAAARAVSLSFISAFYATSDSWWQPNAGRRGESERASLGKSVMQSIGRTRQDAAATVRGKPGRRGGGRVKLGTASKTARDFWEYLRAKATLAAPECRDTSQKVHDRACQRSLARWSRRLTGSTLGGRSFRSHATAGYAPTAVITKRPMRGLSRVDCRPSPRGSEATRLRRFRPFAGRAAFDIKPPFGYMGAATERRARTRALGLLDLHARRALPAMSNKNGARAGRPLVDREDIG